MAVIIQQLQREDLFVEHQKKGRATRNAQYSQFHRSFGPGLPTWLFLSQISEIWLFQNGFGFEKLIWLRVNIWLDLAFFRNFLIKGLILPKTNDMNEKTPIIS